MMISSNTEILNEKYCAKRVRLDDELAAAEEDHDDDHNKFKGVVAQQNGHWGAQIYAKHQRIWLGTFKCEREAAMAYDSATIKLRNGGSDSSSHRNFPWNHQTVQEPRFQSHYTAEAVVTMIRNGTYPSKFSTYLRSIDNADEDEFCSTQLFQKVLTPSDVGKLNRLVIPKKHAVTYFPNCSTRETNINDDDDEILDKKSSCTSSVDEEDNDDVEIVFYDKLMRLWKFRYCYWRSSQSYVFTRGWNRFVKDKKLKAKDTIVFYICESAAAVMKNNCTGDRGQVFSLIDVIYNNNNNNNNNNAVDLEGGGGGGGEKRKRQHFIREENIKGDDAKQVLGNKFINWTSSADNEVEDEDHRTDLNINALHSPHRGLRLFGVRID